MTLAYEKKDSVPSLEDVCVRYVSKHVMHLSFQDRTEPESKRRWKFPYPGYRFPARPAQKILLQLCKRSALDDEKLALFSSDYVDLVSPVIKESGVEASSLKVLKDFHLSNLSVMNLPKVDLNAIVGCLGEWTVRNLISLNVTGISLLCGTRLPILVALSRFKSLQVLNVSRTEFSNSNLQIVADDLPNLQHLNISRTRVTDIHCLLAMKDRLTGLIMHRLELTQREDIEKLLSIVVQLQQLRILDVSGEPRPMWTRLELIDKLCAASTLPHLIHIDLSGNQFGMQLEDARSLVQNHKHLVFAGFASWLNSFEHELEGIHQMSLKYPHITMLGDRGDQLLLNTLTRNKDRALYLQNALHSIFEATSNRESLKPELLQAVLRVMRLHMRRMEMILAGTAVIYNLTRSEQSCQLPIELLNRAVRMTLIAMEKFPTDHQLQKNCFLTLCSDTVLYRASFNSNQCCELVFNNLINFDDVYMKRMGVAIISILAAEIPTASLSELAKDRRRIQCLLKYVSEKCLLTSDLADMGSTLPEYLANVHLRFMGSPFFDTTLRFTLSALWNLTDECPEACLGFVQEGGLKIYEKVLKRFADQDEEVKNHVYTKCLGLLNNVAEVDVTRSTLLVGSLMDFFFKMLRHPSIQISYFAAGIIAHLSCLKDEVWLTALQTTKESYIKVLGQSVCSWQPPQSEMVAYRSFGPFEHLVLHPESRLEVHLWAVWAIHHILTRKEARYVPTLCTCERLLGFLRYVVSVDETVLCTNSLLKRRSSCVPVVDTVGENVSPHTEGHSPSCPAEFTEIFLDATSEAGDFSALPCPCPTSSGDGLCSDTAAVGSRITPVDPVNRTTVGLRAFAGPTQAQLACARLIRQLAAEILDAVDRFSVTPTTS